MGLTISALCIMLAVVISFVILYDKWHSKELKTKVVEEEWGEDFTTNMGMQMRVHKKKDCTPPCPIHAPTDHHMRDWPLHWRSDRKIFERLCKHDVGHPDPDGKYEDYGTVHGCCGCCSPPKEIYNGDV